MTNSQINKIVFAEDARGSDLAQRAISSWPDAEVIQEDAFDKGDGLELANDPTGEGKSVLYLAPNKGRFVRKCPGTMGLVCCNYWVIDLAEGCVIDCSYCILQGYLTDRRIRLATNTEDLIEQIDQELSQWKGPTRFGTGELSDSLMFEPQLGLGSMLIEVFRQRPRATLELKTKTGNINSILCLQPVENIVLGWSLNTQAISNTEEIGSASISQRLEAAGAAVQAGWKVAFHFDPLVIHPGWQEGYREVIDQMYSAVSPDKVAWISLGAFRYHPSLKSVIRSRFKGSSILNQEFVLCPDNKMRYVKPVRQKLFKTVADHIRSISPNAPLYLCMEGVEMWRHVLGSSPAGQQTLCEVFG